MTPRQRAEILQLTRGVIEHQLKIRPAPPAPQVELPEATGGLFVTLRCGGRLRGCMGTFRPLGTLAETVDHVARIACSEDPRFPHDRLRSDELPRLRIEVSVLGEPRRIEDPASLVVGQHGVLVQRGASSGCLLPQVATERGWDAQEFLSQCCAAKAGLDRQAWRDPQTEVFVFTAEILSESTPPPGPPPE